MHPDRVLLLPSHLAKRIEDIVEIYQNLALGNLCDVVHAFASIVSDPSILIGEAGEDRWNNLAQIPGNFLLKSQF